jgi:tRNA pseudouridine55 synthase
MPDASGPTAGFLVLDKPVGITSRAAVDRALGWFPRGTRGGHAGTLDPSATGVLVLCLGVATRLTEYVQQMKKTYAAVLRLGVRSDTDDAEGTITPVAEAVPPDERTVAARLQELVGQIQQVPPVFSAAKVAGRRAYDLARRGKEVALAPRTVTVFEIRLLAYRYSRLEIEVVCGKGTYIRSLARDLGQRLGCGALLDSLRRTNVGVFGLADAPSLDVESAVARSRVLPLSRGVAGLPSVRADSDAIDRLRQGQAIPLSAAIHQVAAESADREIAVFAQDGALAAVGVIDVPTQMLLPRKVFAVRHDFCA